MLRGSLQFGRFLGVGVVNSLLGLLVIYSAKWFFGAGDVIANLLGYSFGLMVSFVLNSRLTFDFTGAWKPAFLRFIAVSAVAYAANLLTVLVAIRHFGVNGYLAQVLGIPIYTLTVFLASKYFVFRSAPGVGVGAGSEGKK